MARLVITESEILDALALATHDTGPEDAQTISEISQRTGICERTVRRALQAAQRQGRLQVHKVYRQGLDGRRCQVPGYTIAAA